ncbi:hypothetical protein HPP92_022998 [Vanilla planifolia]|uniref:Uncharacterized protein n=1 Tax=Vanilla planifolia TaxID=51239 RepID=A0A835UFV1_VANPL|nr:hypothetical protein HPP92_022998 [Vanilla planifolia]
MEKSEFGRHPSKTRKSTSALALSLDSKTSSKAPSTPVTTWNLADATTRAPCGFDTQTPFPASASTKRTAFSTPAPGTERSKCGASWTPAVSNRYMRMTTPSTPWSWGSKVWCSPDRLMERLRSGGGGERGNKGGAEWHAAVETLLKQECAVTALAVNEEAGVLYTGSSDGVVNYFWRSSLARGGELTAHQMAVLCLATAGNMLFTGSADKTICLWERDGNGNHACLSVLTGHEGPVKCLAVVADGEEGGARRWVVYSGSLDKTVKVWKVSDIVGRAPQSGVNGPEGPPIYDIY